MNDSVKLKITKREKTSKGARNRLRREGYLPCSMSEKGKASLSFSVENTEFRKAYNANGMSGIYYLKDGRKKALTAMIREIQYVPGTFDFLHVTFQAVSMTEETTAEIHLHITGKDELHHNGFELLQQLESLHLKGLPGDFPSSIDIDVSQMEAGQHLTVADVEMPEGIECLTEADRMILSVGHPKVQQAETADEDAGEEAAAPALVGEEAAGEGTEGE